MSAYDDIVSRLDFQELADQVGAQPYEVERAVHAVLPALVGGMQANAADPGGASSLLNAVTHHDNGLADGLVDFSQVDTEDGSKIARHVFGDRTDQVVDQLGGLGGGDSGLVARLLPILAPIVLSYLAKQLGQGGGSGTGGGVLGSILGSILSGAASGSGGSGGLGLDDVLGGLGGLLGGGTRG